jgi:hypothetical protein
LTGRVASPASAVVERGSAGGNVVAAVVGATVVEAEVGGEVVVGPADTGVVGVRVETFFFPPPPATPPMVPRTRKATTTHDRICAPNGQPRKRRQGFRGVGEVPVLAPVKFGCVSGGYHFPSEACHQPSPWEKSLTVHHLRCGDFRPQRNVGIGVSVGSGPRWQKRGWAIKTPPTST